MKEWMIIDMTEEDGETAKIVERLLKNVKIAEEKFKKDTNPDKNFYIPFRNAVWATFRGEIALAGLMNFLADLCSIGYTSFLVYLIAWIKDDDASVEQGAAYLGIFFGFMCGSTIFRQYFVFYGYLTSINIRKSLITAMYEKVTKLNMKSLTETNSGKLITIVSGDI